MKKDQQTFNIVLDEVPASPQNCLFIDDNPDNVRVAETVGLAGIQFENAEQLSSELKRMLT